MNSPQHPRKPRALRSDDEIRVVAPSSPFEPATFAKGVHELERLGFRVTYGQRLFERDGYFAGSDAERAADLLEAFADPSVSAVFCARGGFGAAELLPLLDDFPAAIFENPKIFLGFSDATVLQGFFWGKAQWITFQGPMMAAGFQGGADQACGFDLASFQDSLFGVGQNWTFDLRGTALVCGEAEGIILGGCLTMLESVVGTPWECETTGSILLLEDRAMQPYQVDRSLLHMRQAGKFEGVRGIVLGDFPECEPPTPDGVSVLDIFQRHFGEMGIPVVVGAPIGHTPRAMLTAPVGVRGRLRADGRVGAKAEPSGSGTHLEILESPCSDRPDGG